jgi:hypothetical protein
MFNLRSSLRLLAATGAAGVCAGAATAASAQAAPLYPYTTKGAYSYVSVPNLHPPIIHNDAPADRKKLAPGYFMISNFKNLTVTDPMIGQGGPLILDSHLQPVWFKPVGTDVVAFNLATQTYDGKPALSWWQGVINSVGATTTGADYVVDQHYKPIGHPLSGKDGWIISGHELVISGHNGWVTAYKDIPMDLRPYGGSAAGTLTDSAVQEYDLRTGALLNSWEASKHIPLADSQTHPPASPTVGWDAYHVNSIQLTGKGTFLTSMRNTWAGYLVDSASGQIKWTLGGKHSSFTFGPLGGQFHWQHDIELHPGNLVSVFDDACCAIVGPGKFGAANGDTRGLELQLDTKRHTAKQVVQYPREPGFNAAFLGNTQLLPGGNVAIGWGSRPYFSEYSKSGKLLLDAVLPGPNLTYRTLVKPWVGTPYYPPIGAVRKTRGKTTVYASWDGATEVTGWRVLAGSSAKHLVSVAVVGKNGFETAIRLARSYKHYKVQALNAQGHVIGTSKSFPTAAPQGPGFY